MPYRKLLTAVNWLLITACAAIVLYCLLQVSGATDAAGRRLESSIKGVCVFVLLALIGLNLLPYQWNKVLAFLLGIVAVSLFYYTLTR